MRVDEERVKVGYSVDPSRRLKESDCSALIYASEWLSDATTVERAACWILKNDGIRFVKRETFECSSDVAVSAIKAASTMIERGEMPMAFSGKPSKPIKFEVDKGLEDDLDAWIMSQTVPPSRSKVVEIALSEFLANTTN
tara:strand:- start:2437 stop:2856 length:420 start_codon:yes stop_codon:yes gene_type:complete